MSSTDLDIKFKSVSIPNQCSAGKKTSGGKTTYTHGGDQDLGLCPPSLAQDCADLSGTSGTQRMAEGDSTTTRVDLGVVKTQDIQAVDGHRGKGLVDLENVNVVLGELEFLQQLGDGGRWTNAHNSWGHTSNGGTDKLGQNGLSQFNGLGSLHQEDTGS